MADSPQLQEPDDLDLNAPQVIPQQVDEVPTPRFGDSPPWWARQDTDDDPRPTVAELVASAPDSVPDGPPPDLVPDDGSVAFGTTPEEPNEPVPTATDPALPTDGPAAPETATDLPAEDEPAGDAPGQKKPAERPKVPATLVDIKVAGGGKISLPATVMDLPAEPLPAPEPPPHPGPAPQAVVDAVLATGPQPVVTGPLPVVAVPPARPGRAKPVVLLAVGAVLAVGLVASGVGAFLYFSGPPDRQIVTPASVAGLRKHTAGPAAASAAYPFVAAAVANGNVTGSTKSAVYAEAAPGTRSFLVMGGTGPVGPPAAFLDRVKLSTTIESAKAAPGKNGGRAFCGTFAVLSEVHAYCAWATENSYGFVAANTPSAAPQSTELADLMRRVRTTVEKEI